MNLRRPAALLLAGLLALLTLALAPAAAFAMAPAFDTQTLHRHADSYVDCGAFRVIGDFDVTRELATFYDQQGTPIRQVYHLHITGTVTNALTGKSFPAYREGTFTVDLLTGAQVADGQIVRVVVPGAGNVLLTVGRLVFDASGTIVFEAGPHALQDYIAGDTAAIQQLCAALA